MTSKKFVNLVYDSMIFDDFDIYNAAIAVKEHYNIEDEVFLGFLKQEKTLKQDIKNCCQQLGLVKKEKPSSEIEELF